MSNILENELENENNLETFFNLLNTNQENFNASDYNTTNSLSKISKYQDNEINSGIQYLETSEKQIVSKNNSINEVNENTSLLYNYIYTIFITILVIIILGIITYLKNVLNMNESMYMILIILTILSYVFYIMYLFNIMYVQESVNKIINFIRTGRFEIGGINLGKVPQSVYIQELCKKQKVLKSVTSEENNNEMLIKNNKSLAPIPNVDDKNHYFYNDNNAPKQQLYPVIKNKDAQYGIENVDADMNIRNIINTSRL